MTPLIVIGSGGFAGETVEAVRAVNDARPTWDLLGYLDDDPARAGTRRLGAPVLGSLDLLADRPDAQVVICTGRPDDYTSRRRIARALDLPADRYATVVHPSVQVPASARIGVGTVVLAQVALTAEVTIGQHVALMPACVLTHDVVVEDFATLASGVLLGGGTTVATGAYVGAGAVVREGRRLGAWSMTGMGSVVTRDVPPERLWFGSPATDRSAAPVPAGISRT
jgi:sugar O-acyltransferase (sialic acid O-acetyltransferase NeuD family)